MFNLEMLEGEDKVKLKEFFTSGDYTSITVLFLDKGVTRCPECASNYTAIKQWCEYWVATNKI